MRTLAKNVQNQLFRTLEINQSLTTIQGAFMQGEWWMLSKNISSCFIPPPPQPSSMVALKTKNLTSKIAVKICNIAVTGGEKRV